MNRDILVQSRLVAVLFGLFLCFVFIGSRPYQNLLVADSSGQTDAMRQIAVFGVSALAILVSLLERSRTPSFTLVTGVALALALFLLASSTWSEQPGFVIRRAGLFLLVSFSLCVLGDYLHRAGLLLPTLVGVLLVVLAIDVLSMILLHAVSVDHDGRWKGIHIHKNVAGSIMALATIVFGWLGTERRRWLPVAAISAFFLVMTASKTSFALLFGSCAFTLVVVSLRTLRGLGGLRAVPLALAALALLAAAIDVGALIDRLVELVYGDVTLTGRVFILDYVIAKHAESPWLGYGYGSFWGMGDLTPAISEGIPMVRDFGEAHNGYLDLLVQIGRIGTALFALLLLGVLGAGVRRVLGATGDWRRAALCLNIILFVMLHNLLESTWLSALAVEWTLFVLAALMLMLERPARRSGRLPTTRPRSGAALPGGSPVDAALR